MHHGCGCSWSPNQLGAAGAVSCHALKRNRGSCVHAEDLYAHLCICVHDALLTCNDPRPISTSGTYIQDYVSKVYSSTKSPALLCLVNHDYQSN